MTEITKELDLKGLNCPLPILRIKQTVSRMESGEVLKIVGTEPGTERELKIFCKQGGHDYLDYQESNSGFTYMIRIG